MRKCLTVSIFLLLLLFQTTSTAFAAVQSAGADIPVVIEGGGTAYLIPEINSPLPKEVSIEVGNGRTGHFHISFTETGVFRYTIKADFTKPDGDQPSNEIFYLTVTVYERNGQLHTVSVIKNNHSTTKPDEIRFQAAPEGPTETETTTETSTWWGGGDGSTVPSSWPYDITVPTTRHDDTTETTTRPYETTRPGDTTAPATRPYETTVTVPSTTAPYNTTVPTTSESETKLLPRIFRAPKTGDESHLAYYLLIAMASSAGLFCLSLLYTATTNKLMKKD